MNAQSRARAAAVPLDRLNLRSQNGRRELRRRLRLKAGELGNAWERQTGRPVNKPRGLKNNLGHRPRWRWVAKA